MSEAPMRNTWVQLAAYVKDTLQVETMDEFLGRRIELVKLIRETLEKQGRNADSQMVSYYLSRLKQYLFPERSIIPRGKRGRKKRLAPLPIAVPSGNASAEFIHTLLQRLDRNSEPAISPISAEEEEPEEEQKEGAGMDRKRYRVNGFFPEMQQEEGDTPRIDVVSVSNTLGRLPTIEEYFPEMPPSVQHHQLPPPPVQAPVLPRIDALSMFMNPAGRLLPTLEEILVQYKSLPGIDYDKVQCCLRACQALNAAREGGVY